MNFKIGNEKYILLDERILHNKIRRQFKILSSWAREEFKREYKNRFESIEDVERIVSALGISIINEIIIRCVDILDKEEIGVTVLDLSDEKVINATIWEEECNKILSSGIAFKNPILLSAFLEKLEERTFNINEMVVNKIIEKKGNVISKTINTEEKEKCAELINKYKGRTLEEKEALNLIDLNPYNNEVYKIIIDKLGDEEKDIEKLCENMDIDYYILKSELVQEYYENLKVVTEKDVVEGKESLTKYGMHIGFDINEALITELDNKLVECIKNEDERILKENFNVDNISTIEKGEELLIKLNKLEIRTEAFKSKKIEEIEGKLKELKETLDEKKINKVIDSYVFLTEEQVYSAIEEVAELDVIYEWTKDKACEYLSDNVEKLIKNHRELLGRARRYEDEFVKKTKKENIFEEVFKKIFRKKAVELSIQRVEKDKEAYEFITNFGERSLDDME